MTKRPRRPPHPGTVLLEKFLKPRGIRQATLARHIDEYVPNFNGIIKGRRRITPRNAWMLAGALGTSPEYWMDLQVKLDLWLARPRRPAQRLPSNNGQTKKRPARR